MCILDNRKRKCEDVVILTSSDDDDDDDDGNFNNDASDEYPEVPCPEVPCPNDEEDTEKGYYHFSIPYYFPYHLVHTGKIMFAKIIQVKNIGC